MDRHWKKGKIKVDYGSFDRKIRIVSELDKKLAKARPVCSQISLAETIYLDTLAGASLPLPEMGGVVCVL